MKENSGDAAPEPQKCPIRHHGLSEGIRIECFQQFMAMANPNAPRSKKAPPSVFLYIEETGAQTFS